MSGFLLFLFWLAVGFLGVALFVSTITSPGFQPVEAIGSGILMGTGFTQAYFRVLDS